MNKKPPILNIALAEADKCRGWESDRKRFIDWKLECQRDNDVAYYEPIIQQARREIFAEIEESSHTLSLENSEGEEHYLDTLDVDEGDRIINKEVWQSLKDKFLKVYQDVNKADFICVECGKRFDPSPNDADSPYTCRECITKLRAAGKPVV